MYWLNKTHFCSFFRFQLLIICSLVLFACTDKDSIHLGVTTTLDDAGVLPLLIKKFEEQHPISVKPVIAGSGQIHRLVESGDIDTAITHDPMGEQNLLSDGKIIARNMLIQNDFIIVGPSNDPAHIKLSLTPDEAFEKIANTDNTFISRDDNSGTHQMEKRWRKKIAYTNDSAKIIRTGTGMGSTLAVAIDKNAYTLVDRGTWLNYANKEPAKILYENRDDLPNIYSVLTLPKTRSKSEHVRLWENWLIQEGVTLLKAYRINNQAVFFKEK